MTDFSLRPIIEEDKIQVVDIFNHYVQNGFAAFPEKPVPYTFFDVMRAKCKGYPSFVASTATNQVAGFGMLSPWHPIPVFSATAEISYFLAPQFTGKGLGSTILQHLLQAAQKQGIRTILACISSLNDGSIRFHARQGFQECGRFLAVGNKQGQTFDSVWMQLKEIPSR